MGVDLGMIRILEGFYDGLFIVNLWDTNYRYDFAIGENLIYIADNKTISDFFIEGLEEGMIRNKY